MDDGFGSHPSIQIQSANPRTARTDALARCARRHARQVRRRLRHNGLAEVTWAMAARVGTQTRGRPRPSLLAARDRNEPSRGPVPRYCRWAEVALFGTRLARLSDSRRRISHLA